MEGRWIAISLIWIGVAVAAAFGTIEGITTAAVLGLVATIVICHYE